MPQGKTEITTPGGARKQVNIRKKFKLGGRGQSINADQQSTDSLLERLTSSTASGKDKHKIRQVLDKRNVTV